MLVCDKQEYIDAWLTAAEVCRFLFLRGVYVPRGAVHGIHEIIMEDSDAVTEASRRNY